MPDFGRAARALPVAGAIIGACGGGGAAAGAAAWALPPCRRPSSPSPRWSPSPARCTRTGSPMSPMVLAAARPARRKLEIMRDSRLGAYGAAALVLALLLRVSALAAIAEHGDWRAVLALVAAGGGVPHRWAGADDDPRAGARGRRGGGGGEAGRRRPAHRGRAGGRCFIAADRSRRVTGKRGRRRPRRPVGRLCSSRGSPSARSAALPATCWARLSRRRRSPCCWPCPRPDARFPAAPRPPPRAETSTPAPGSDRLQRQPAPIGPRAGQAGEQAEQMAGHVREPLALGQPRLDIGQKRLDRLETISSGAGSPNNSASTRSSSAGS